MFDALLKLRTGYVHDALNAFKQGLESLKFLIHLLIFFNVNNN